jgi:hyperosmotically inducible protein
MREKPIGDSMTDTRIEAIIKANLYKVSPELYSAVSVNVDNRCVLLTGAVQRLEWVSIAERESWKVSGVATVDNNVIFGKTIDLATIMKDGMITSKVRGHLLCSSNVKSSNYKVKTMNGVIYIRGVSATANELNNILQSIQHIHGVKKIVSYVVVQNKKTDFLSSKAREER